MKLEKITSWNNKKYVWDGCSQKTVCVKMSKYSKKIQKEKGCDPEIEELRSKVKKLSSKLLSEQMRADRAVLHAFKMSLVIENIDSTIDKLMSDLNKLRNILKPNKK